MTTMMVFPGTRPQQTASIYAQKATAQQNSSIDISNIMNLMLPAVVTGMPATTKGNGIT